MKALTATSAIALLGCHAEQVHQVLGAPAASDVLRGDIYYDCDAASGHTSQWSRTIDPAGSVTGVLFIKEVRLDDNWRPFGGVLISGPRPDNTAGIQVTVDGETMLLAELRYPKRSSNAAFAHLDIGRAATTGIQFSLQWEANKLQVRTDAAAPWNDVYLPFKPERLWLVCATSNVVFHSVSVTTTPPASVTQPVPAATDAPPP